jgi:hypothetical protein
MKFYTGHTHLFPTFRGEVEAPEVLVVVKLRLCRTREFATEDPELAAALGHQHRLPHNKNNKGVTYEKYTITKKNVTYPNPLIARSMRWLDCNGIFFLKNFVSTSLKIT